MGERSVERMAKRAVRSASRVKSIRRARVVSGGVRHCRRQPQNLGWPLQTTRILERFRVTFCSLRMATALGEASEAYRWPYRRVVCIDECPSNTRDRKSVV